MRKVSLLPVKGGIKAVFLEEITHLRQILRGREVWRFGGLLIKAEGSSR